MNDLIGYLQANPALVVATLSLLLAIYVRLKNSKDVKVYVLSMENLFSTDNEERKRFTILYDKILVDDVFIVTVRVKNRGGIAVIPADFHNPLKFDFGENSTVLFPRHVTSIPANLHAQLSYHANSPDIIEKNLVRLEPLLLNQGASILLKFLVLNSDSCVPSANIVGVKSIHPAPYISGMRDLLQNRKFQRHNLSTGR